MNIRERRGQSLVELAATLPIIFITFLGLYTACRTGFLVSKANSAAQAEALRVGRGMPGIEKPLAETLLPGEPGASVKSGSGRTARLLPSPFPSLAGRSSGVVSVTKEWSESGNMGGFPALALARRVDLSADCWNGNSKSGKNIRRLIQARVALGWIR